MGRSHVRSIWLTLGVAGIALVALLVAAQPAPVGAQSQAIAIQGFAFSPASLQVDAGTTVTWTNNDNVAHTVTADDGSFDSGPIQPGASFSHTFATAGTVAYHCSIHPFMTAQIVVLAANNGGQATAAPPAPVQTAVSGGTAPAAMTADTGNQATAAPADTAAAGGAAAATTSSGPTLPNTGSGSSSSGFGRGLVVLLGGAVLLLALGASAARLRRRGARPQE